MQKILVLLVLLSAETASIKAFAKKTEKAEPLVCLLIVVALKSCYYMS